MFGEIVHLKYELAMNIYFEKCRVYWKSDSGLTVQKNFSR